MQPVYSVIKLSAITHPDKWTVAEFGYHKRFHQKFCLVRKHVLFNSSKCMKLLADLFRIEFQRVSKILIDNHYEYQEDFSFVYF